MDTLSIINKASNNPNNNITSNMSDKSKIQQLDEELHQWNVVFNELCVDGIYRPVYISPRSVTNVKRLDPPHKIGDYTANTLISYKEPDSFDGTGKSGEFFVFETIELVLSALGTTIAASDHYCTNFFLAGKEFESRGIKYFPNPKQL
jgi:hypothetical protein